MKKVGILVAVAVLLGGASGVFAQSPSAEARISGQALSGMATKVDSKQIAANSEISKIQQKGTKAALTYTLRWAPCVIGGYGPCAVGTVRDVNYPKNGSTFPGYIYKANAKQVLILMSRADWKKIDGQSPSFLEHPVVDSHTFATGTGQTYAQRGSRGLKHKHHTIGDKEYTVVTVNLD